MADCLTSLREQVILSNKLKDVQETSDHIIIGELAWPKTTKTNYLVYGRGLDSDKREYYTLAALVFLLRNVSLPHPQYVRQAGAANVQPVSLPDRKTLLDYLNGKIDWSESIDKSAPPQIPLQKPAVIKKTEEATAEKKRRLDLEDEDLAMDKVRWAAHIDAPKATNQGPITVKDSGLNSILSKERIAELKAKKLAKMRTTIKGVDDFNEVQPVSRTYLQMDSDVTKEILSKERVHRTRKTILQCHNRDLFKNINVLLNSVKSRDDAHPTNGAQPNQNPTSTADRPAGRQHHHQQQHHHHHHQHHHQQQHGHRNQLANGSGVGAGAVPHTPVTPKPVQPVAYSRFDQEKFTKHPEIAEHGFRIDTMGTYHGQNLRKVTEDPTPLGLASPGRPKPNPAGVGGSDPSATVVDTQLVGGPGKRASKTPIIVIPASPNSLITLFNVRDLLQDLRFVSSEDRRKSGIRKDNEVLIQRPKEGGFTVPYRVVDSITRLQEHDWQRVVGVFVQGPAWQFKGWPWHGNPVDIFSRIKAFHLKWAELPLDQNVANWNVKVLPLDRNKRHLDRAMFQVFWAELDRYMQKNKSQLRW